MAEQPSASARPDVGGWVLRGADRIGRGGLGFVPIIVFLLVSLVLSRWIPFPIVVAAVAILLAVTRSKTSDHESDTAGEPNETESP